MPRLRVRSMWTSCNTPFSTTATRVSCGVTLIRISSLICCWFYQPSLARHSGTVEPQPGHPWPCAQRRECTLSAFANSPLRPRSRGSLPDFFQNPGQLVERQAHDTGITAFQAFDERRRLALDGIGPGLVRGFARLPVLRDFRLRQRTERDAAGAQRGMPAAPIDHANRRKNFVRPAGQAAQQGHAMSTILRLSQNLAVQHHFRVRPQYRENRQAALMHQFGHELRLVARHPQDIVGGRFPRLTHLENIRRHRFEFNAKLAQQFLPSRRCGSQVDHSSYYLSYLSFSRAGRGGVYLWVVDPRPLILSCRLRRRITCGWLTHGSYLCVRCAHDSKANGGWLRPCTLGDFLLLVQEKVTKEKDTRSLRRTSSGSLCSSRDQALA